MRVWFTSVFIIGLLSACGSDIAKVAITETPVQQAQPGKYLFAAVYQNYAWAKTTRGFVIKGNGDLYYFDVSATNAALPDTTSASEAELTRFFEAARFEYVQTIATDQLNSLWQQSEKLSNDTLGKEQSICRDAGNYSYLLFQPSGNQQYQQTLIYQTGDFRREQQDSKAEPIKDYLVKQAVKLQIAYILDPNSNNWCSGL
ncbi:hypothetical protein [Rheinheimera texasensis]|uniref:hypothetical protein n=1 Tax=Rheinheimera texasensis TaxID=306205 RepID=UPI0032B2B89F